MGNFFASNNEPHILVVEKNSHWAAPKPLQPHTRNILLNWCTKKTKQKAFMWMFDHGCVIEWWRGQMQTVTNCMTLAVSAWLQFFGPCNLFAHLVDLIDDIPTDQKIIGKYNYATKTGHLIAIQTTFYSRLEPNSKTTKAPSLWRFSF